MTWYIVCFITENTVARRSSTYSPPTFVTNKKEAVTSSRSQTTAKKEANPWDEVGKSLLEAINARNKRKMNSAKKAGSLREAAKYEKRIRAYEKGKNQQEQQRQQAQRQQQEQQRQQTQLQQQEQQREAKERPMIEEKQRLQSLSVFNNAALTGNSVFQQAVAASKNYNCSGDSLPGQGMTCASFKLAVKILACSYEKILDSGDIGTVQQTNQVIRTTISNTEKVAGSTRGLAAQCAQSGGGLQLRAL